MNLSRIGEMVEEIAWAFGDRGKGQNCCRGLSQVEVRVLGITSGDRGCSMQTIAKRLGFTKSGGTRVIDRLVAKGLLERCHSEEDGRVCCVLPTKRGLSLLREIREERTARLQTILSRMDPEPARELENSFGAFVRAFQKDT